jgi:hypothetical protein
MGISDCFENISIPPCIWFEGGDKRNAYASIIAGFLVGLPVCLKMDMIHLFGFLSSLWDGG